MLSCSGKDPRIEGAVADESETWSHFAGSGLLKLSMVRGRQQNEKLEEAIRMSVSKKRSTKERIASDIEDILWVHSA